MEPVGPRDIDGAPRAETLNAEKLKEEDRERRTDHGFMFP